MVFSVFFFWLSHGIVCFCFCLVMQMSVFLLDWSWYCLFFFIWPSHGIVFFLAWPLYLLFSFGLVMILSVFLLVWVFYFCPVMVLSLSLQLLFMIAFIIFFLLFSYFLYTVYTCPRDFCLSNYGIILFFPLGFSLQVFLNNLTMIIVILTKFIK